MKKISSIILLLAAALLIWGAGARQGSLLEKRAEYHLDSNKPLENAPPLMAFTTVALGGFGGLLADALWLRVSYLQDEGKFMEIVQLADWITKLEPRCAEIWSFHAWNMAYNVSVAMPDAEDRWRWVSNGIKLLRDEGMLYNPADASLYQDLGWMFQNKIGRATDEANQYYKFKWAEEMTLLFGGEKPDYGKIESDAALKKAFMETYKLIPGVMKEMESAYGPLDWRLPQAHAIYWAYRGRQLCQKKYMIQYDRMIYQAMADAFPRGRLVSGGSAETLAEEPNFDLLEYTIRTFDQALRKYPIESVKSAYESFLRHSVLLLHDYQREKEARNLFDLLCRKFPSQTTLNGYDAFIAARGR